MMLFLNIDDPLPLLAIKVRLNDILRYLDTTEPDQRRAQVDVELHRIFQEWDRLNELTTKETTP